MKSLNLNRLVAVLLVMAMLLPCVLIANAAQESLPILESEKLALIDVLSEIEQQKDAWGLGNVDFAELRIGLPIQTYNYVDGLMVSGNAMYPLTVNNQLVLWAIPVDGQFQVSGGLVSEINEAVNADTPFALIYDSRSAFIYSDGVVSMLKQYNDVIESRDTLNLNASFTVQGIETVSLSEGKLLGYTSMISNISRASVNYACSVNYVTQQPYDNLCWAATVACIVNYVNGTSLDAVTVAKRYYGNTDFDQGIGCDNLREKIQDYGLIYYQYSIGEPFDNKILSSIIAGYPVGGTFDVVGGDYHACTIFGINVIAGRIQVMDPEFGSTTAWFNNDSYTYVSSYTNSTLNLYSISYDTGN